MAVTAATAVTAVTRVLAVTVAPFPKTLVLFAKTRLEQKVHLDKLAPVDPAVEVAQRDTYTTIAGTMAHFTVRPEAAVASDLQVTN